MPARSMRPGRSGPPSPASNPVRAGGLRRDCHLMTAVAHLARPAPRRPSHLSYCRWRPSEAGRPAGSTGPPQCHGKSLRVHQTLVLWVGANDPNYQLWMTHTPAGEKITNSVGGDPKLNDLVRRVCSKRFSITVQMTRRGSQSWVTSAPHVIKSERTIAIY